MQNPALACPRRFLGPSLSALQPQAGRLGLPQYIHRYLVDSNRLVREAACTRRLGLAHLGYTWRQLPNPCRQF